MSKALSLDLALSSDSLDRYFQSIKKIAILSAEEENELALRLYRDNDLDAARQLIMAHLRFVVHIANGYKGYGLPLHDLIQEGNLGLMKAVKRFDPDRGVRLISFAVHWIKAEIHEYILRNWRIVKVATTKAQRKLFFNLRSKKKRLGWFSNDEVNAVAKDLGVKPETVLEMESRLSAQDATYDTPVDMDDNDHYVAPAAYLTDGRMDPAQQLEASQWGEHNTERLQEALETLDERSHDILAQRWLREEKSTLHKLADKYQVSAERIRQLEASAIKKLKVALLA